MSRRPLTPFLWERTSLLHRNKTLELWEGTIQERPYLIKRFTKPGSNRWSDFLLQSRIRHSLFLRPELAGYSGPESFCYAIPAHFSPKPLPETWDFFRFAIQFLSLAHALHSRGQDFRWDDKHLLYDPGTERVFLAGLHSLRETGSGKLQENDAELLNHLRVLGVKHSRSAGPVLNILKRWERRKNNVLDGCLEEMLQKQSATLDETISCFDWRFTREIELIAGLFQMAERSSSRSVLFYSGAGEGKTELLRQLYREILSRNALLTCFSAPAQTQPFHSLRKLLDQFFENTGAYRFLKKELAEDGWIHFLDGSREIRDDAAETFCKIVEKLCARHGAVCVFLVDDLDHFDQASLYFLNRLLERIHTLPLLFLFTACGKPALPDSVLMFPLEPAAAFDPVRSYEIPFWKQEQKKIYMDGILARTAATPLLFDQYLKETLRQQHRTLRWEDRHWTFSRKEIPALPETMQDFLIKSNLDLSAQEFHILEIASVQGPSFDPELLGDQEGTNSEWIELLMQKGILIRGQGEIRFARPLLAEALYRKIRPDLLRQYHSVLASRLLGSGNLEQTPAVARHLLKAGDYEGTLSIACKMSEGSWKARRLVLQILKEMEPFEAELSQADRLRLYRLRGELLSRRGNYPGATADYRLAFTLSEGEDRLQFELGVKIVQCLLQNNEIFPAQEMLHELGPLALRIQDPKWIHQFYLARGVCAWFRGDRRPDDFDRAMEIAEKNQDYNSLANGYRQCAELALREGSLSQARTKVRKALSYCRKTDNREELGHAWRLLASIAWRQSQYSRAEHGLRRSIRVFRKLENLDGMARGWNLFGNIYMERSRFSHAMAAFQKALTLFNLLDHSYEQSLVRFNIGLIHTECGRLQEAEQIFQRCRSLDQKAGNKRYYAYDLRALAVVCMQRGFHRKAERLLKRTLELCEELHAEGDLLQTKLILLANELELKNYRSALPLIEYLRKEVPGLNDGRTQAQIHFLAAAYFVALNDAERAGTEITKSIHLARRLGLINLIGQCLILRLILRDSLPRPGDPDLMRAIRYLEKDRNRVEFADSFLCLYQTYPLLLREREHAGRMVRMEKIYQGVRHRSKHRVIQRLLRGKGPAKAAAEPVYERWRSLLETLRLSNEFAAGVNRLLVELSSDLGASCAVFQFLNESGVYERIAHSNQRRTDVAGDLESHAVGLVLRRGQTVRLDAVRDPDLQKFAGTGKGEVGSVLAVPLISGERVSGLWYFERSQSDPCFSQREQEKMAFVLTAFAPVVESGLQAELSRRALPTTSVPIGLEGIVGRSSRMTALYRQIEKLAPLEISVLIQGESGTGKELIARSLHRKSGRASAPFLALNCSALPETLIESELFGFNRGAFTGATAAKPGLIERAHTGTLFLDEIGDFSGAAQAKLLRVLQEREIQRLGDHIVRKVDVRFLFATHRDLKKLVQEGAYREDLFYRISVYSLNVPALRDRTEDIPILVNYLVVKYSRSFGKSGMTISPHAIHALCEYFWPGNVRELENVIQSLLVNCDSGGRIEVKDLPASVMGRKLLQKMSIRSLEEAKEEFEREFVTQALNRNKWNKTHTARELKMTRQGLVNMIQRLDLKQK